MHTVQPSIMIGAYTWDQDRLPRDEFAIRAAELDRVMDKHGWKAMFIHGDAREHSALAYYTNFVPRLRWALALIPREGEPRLLVSMSSRDMPAMKLTTWIGDVLCGWQWESAFDGWLAGLKGEGPIGVGTIGFEFIQPRLLRSVDRSIGERIRLNAADGFGSAERALRPRELSLVREACSVARAAARAIVKSWRGGEGAETAVLAGERTARAMAAQDVRTLVSLDGGRTLVPFRGEFKAKTGPLVAYIAVKVMGYWAELFVTVEEGASKLLPGVQSGLDALKTGVRPGVTGVQLHAQVKSALGSQSLHPVLSGSVGRRIGLALNEGGDLRHDAQRPVVAGDVYALHVGVREPDGSGALVSALVAVTTKGPEILCSSDDALAP
jgi:Xaa-Pro aminopeptidase